MNSKDSDSNKPAAKPSVFQVILSTLAAAVGVQSSRNRERDFSGNNLLTYVVAGLVFTAIFVGGLMVWVQHLLASN